jgi:hypothetical protein
MAEKTVGDLVDEAEKVILTRIIENGSKGGSKDLLRLAEVYAWISFPNQSHGASGGDE